LTEDQCGVCYRAAILSEIQRRTAKSEVFFRMLL